MILWDIADRNQDSTFLAHVIWDKQVTRLSFTLQKNNGFVDFSFLDMNDLV